MATVTFLSTFAGKSSLFNRQLVDFPDPFEYGLYRSYCVFRQATFQMTPEEVNTFVVKECYIDSSRNSVIDALLFQYLSEHNNGAPDIKILYVVVADNAEHFLSRMDYILRSRLCDLKSPVMAKFLEIVQKVSSLNYFASDYVLMLLLRASLSLSWRDRNLVTDFSYSVAGRIKKSSIYGPYLTILLMSLSTRFRTDARYYDILVLLRGFIDFSSCDKVELMRLAVLLGSDHKWSSIFDDIQRFAGIQACLDSKLKVISSILPFTVEKDLQKLLLLRNSKDQLRFALNTLADRHQFETENNYLIPEIIRFIILQLRFEETEKYVVVRLFQTIRTVYSLAEAKLALFLDILNPEWCTK